MEHYKVTLVEGSFNEAGLKLHICTAKQINQGTKECTTASTSFLASGKYKGISSS